MKILFYDVETTGLPEFSKPSEDPCQPRVTQMSAELVDEDTREVYAGLHTIIEPDGWTIPEELEKLTGITNEKALDVGQPMSEVLPLFISMWRRCDVRVAHNQSFDARMIRIEIMRHEFYSEDLDLVTVAPVADTWKDGPAFCTQTNSTKLIQLPPTPKMIAANRKHFKSPNLGEAYRFFTGIELEGAHNAVVDVLALKAIYFGIKRMTTAAEPTPPVSTSPF